MSTYLAPSHIGSSHSRSASPWPSSSTFSTGATFLAALEEAFYVAFTADFFEAFFAGLD